MGLVLAGAAVWAHADAPHYELVIERSPINAGDVTPNTGAHRFSPDSTITLTADPQPGYRFAYWLGDVSDPTSERTSIVLNEPKVVIAIFQPAPDRPVEDEIRSAGGGGGGADGMLLVTASDFSSPGWSPAGGAAQSGPHTVPVIVPVIPTPEPATVALLAVGALILRRRPQTRCSAVLRSPRIDTDTAV